MSNISTTARSIPIHPFLISLMPILFLYQYSLREIPIQDIVLPLIFSISLIAAIWFVLKNFIGSTKSSLIISLVLLLLIIFSLVRLFFANHEAEHIQFLGKNFILFPVISSICIIGIIFILRKKIPVKTTSIVNVMSVVIILILGCQIMFYFISDDSQIKSLAEFVEIPIFQSSVIDKPDVYFLLLDAYSGDVTLKNDNNFDNSEFKNKLKERGFFIPKTSFSNYPNTNLSMPSITNMVYLDSIANELGKDSKVLTGMREIRNENNVMKIFKANGYHTTSFYGSDINVATSKELLDDLLCGSMFNLDPELQRAFVYMYFPFSFSRALLNDNMQYDRLECTFSTILNLEKKNEKPLYVHAHLFFPHPPFVYDADGNRVAHPNTDDQFDPILREPYLQQTIFANKKTIEMVDSIQKRDSNAVIIVMSDHGGRFGVDWSNPTEMDYYRALEILQAFYFPGQEENIPEEFATVNVFRIFFNLYLDANYESLEDRQFWNTTEKPFDLTDVTDKLMK